jgi:tetratricopeptide (TPR) repeat protein
MRMRASAALVMAVLAASCAPMTLPALPVVSAPKFPEFIQPAVPPGETTRAAETGESRGWIFLQAGDFRSAEREFLASLRLDPGFYPADISLGYVELARKDGKAALTHFDRVLQEHAGDVSALAGRGQADLALGREAEALAAFAAAVAANPALTDLARRVDVLKFRGVEQNLAMARAAAKAERFEDAIRAFGAAIASSPDSAFLYRELAAVERQSGDVDGALDHFRKAASLDPSDAASLVQIGDILQARDDFEGAAKAFGDALAIEPSAGTEARLDEATARVDLARLPAEYRAIADAAQATRADLAALIGIRLAPLLQADRRQAPVVITDIRNIWAAVWINMVTRAGIMDAFDNHAFQPRTILRRADLAMAASRLLTRIAAARPARDAQAQGWASARLKFSDLAATHLAYPAASAAIASGVMKANPDGTFQSTRAVSGAEAIEVIDKLQALAGLPAARPLGTTTR